MCSQLPNEELREIYNGLSFIKAVMEKIVLCHLNKIVATRDIPKYMEEFINSTRYNSHKDNFSLGSDYVNYPEEYLGGSRNIRIILLSLKYFGEKGEIAPKQGQLHRIFIEEFMKQIGRYLYETGYYKNYEFIKQDISIVFNSEMDFVNAFCNDYMYRLDKGLITWRI